MSPFNFKCKACGWVGSSEEVDEEVVETCFGDDITEVCPECGSQELMPVATKNENE